MDEQKLNIAGDTSDPSVASRDDEPEVEGHMIAGSVAGDVAGNVAGSPEGFVAGSPDGFIAGDVAGDVAG